MNISSTELRALNEAQASIWFAQMLDRNDPASNIGLCVEIDGAVDESLFEQAVRLTVMEADGLHLRFVETEAGPKQYYRLDENWSLPFIDLSSEANSRAAADAWMQADLARPFDLTGEQLFRFAVLRLGPDCYAWYVATHHIVCDGFGGRLIVGRTAELYSSLVDGRGPTGSSLCSYDVLLDAERIYVNSEHHARDRNYWLKTLEGRPTDGDLSMRAVAPGPGVHQASAAMTDGLDVGEFARSRALNPAAVLMAAVAVYLYRITGAADLTLGVQVSNRLGEQSRRAVGVATNAVPIRTSINAKESFEVLCRRLASVMREGYRHQRYGWQELRHDLGLSGLRRGGFAGLVNYIPIGDNVKFSAFDVRLRLLPIGHEEGIQFRYSAASKVNGSHLDIFANSARYTLPEIQEHMRRFLAMFARCMSEPETACGQVVLLQPAERQRIVYDWNATKVEYPSQRCVHELIEEQVEKTPDATAVVHEDEQLSYGELNARANRLAHHLIGLGVKPDDRVAICMERSLELVVGILGILKSGGAYVPLDPSYPIERLAYMLEDIAPVVVLTQAKLRQIVERSASAAPVLELDGESSSWVDKSNSNPRRDDLGLRPDHLIYVIYTSGSTGRPKGVMVKQNSSVNLLEWYCRSFEFNDRSRVLSISSHSFDLAQKNLFAPLLVGGRLYLPRHGYDPQHFAELIDRHSITTINCAPSSFYPLLRLIKLPASLRHVFLGGEPIQVSQLAAWYAGGRIGPRIHNTYGPTEATDVVTSYDWDPKSDAATVPLGRPIANTQIYILDQALEPVPVGVAGELYVGGVGVARGYLNRPDLTAERFLEDPFAGDATARMYKTGDLALYMPDGNIEYLGRNDFQVKIRGFRIELGEIEARLREHADVREAVVLVHADEAGNQQLMTYYVAADHAAPSAEGLRQHLASVLPDYMVPAAYVRLPELPLTPNGKLDRQALPAPDEAAFGVRSYEAPQGQIEMALASIWSELLNVERIGRHDNFFDLGGHSLMAVQLVSRIRSRLGLEVPLSELVLRPTLAGFSPCVASADISQLNVIEKADRSESLPLSFAQQRLWFLAQLDERASLAYHIAGGVRLRGALNEDALKQALHCIVARHEALRTSFRVERGVPVQWIAPPECGFSLRTLDLRGLAGKEAELGTVVCEEAAEPFALQHGPLIRGRLVCMSDQDYALLVTMHHIVSDGWSIGVLLRELSTLYAAFSQGKTDPLPPLPIQYADYAVWQRRHLEGEVLERQLEFWKQHLADAPALLELPHDHSRPAAKDYRGKSYDFSLDKELSAALRGLSRRHGMTLFMTLLTGWAVLLSRLSGQHDLVIGMPVANRTRADIEPLIGFFANTLALRVDLSGAPSAAELLSRVRNTVLAAQANQDVPFEQLVEVLRPSRSLSYSPLFQVMFAWESKPAGTFDLPGVSLQEIQPTASVAKFDLELSLRDRGEEIVGSFVYAEALFERSTVERHVAHLQAVLRALVQDDTRTVDQLEVLGSAERQRILYHWNATEAEFLSERCIHELIEQQAAKTPDALAVAFDDTAITYAELNARANRLAHRLIAEGLKPDERVAIAFERSIEMVVALLATLKAGGAYVPLDPTYPVERLQLMLRDSAPRVLLTQESVLPGLGPALCGSSVLMLDTGSEAWQDYSSENPDARLIGLTSRHLAYVIYTSGSTGTPKGVMVEHRSLQSSINARLRTYGGYERVLLVASISFDSSVAAIFGSLTMGGTLVVAGSDAAVAPESATGLLARWKVTCILGVPSFLNALCDGSAFTLTSELKQVVTGGEQCTSDLVRKVARWAPRATLFNEYGPTEATVWATVQNATECSLSAVVPIGRPIANARIYILDIARNPVPVGVVGEIYIGGTGVARGYLNQPDLTAERFLRDPFAEAAGHANARMYRTGDLARWLPDGTIEFLGRNDSQVKIRGYRVELGEIEARLGGYPGVHEVAVLAPEDRRGGKRLVAYYTGAEGIAAADLRAHLALLLPDYMVPAAYVWMPALPLTPNGKLDRGALPAPDQETSFGIRNCEAPEGPFEQALAAIWAELLNVERIGRRDDFFDLGGHSLLVTQVGARIRRDFNVELPLRVIFESSTLMRLAHQIQEALRVSEPGTLLPLIGEARPMEHGGRRGEEGASATDKSVLSYSQQRMWLIQTLDPQNAAYNMCSVVRLAGSLDQQALAQAFDILRNRHENLRSVFFESAGEVWQKIVPWQPEDLVLTDLRFLGDGASAEALKRIEADARTPFDLERGPVLRVLLYRIADDNHLLQINLHHISGDQWSIAVLGRELAAVYNAIGARLPPSLPPLHIHYQDYARWQRRYIEDKNLPAISYWTERLKNVPALDLPIDLPRPRLRSHNGAVEQNPLSDRLLDELNALSRRENSTLFMTMLAAFALQLYRLTGQQDFAIGVPIANRTQADVENMVGTFVNLLALRIDLSGNPSFQQLLQRVRSVALDAYTHQDVPFDKLVQEVQYTRDDRRAPLVQVMFNMPNVPFHGVAFDDLTWEPVIVDRGGAQFELSISVDTQLKSGVTIEYNTDLFQPATVKRFAAQYLEILRSVLENPAENIDAVPLLPARERQLLLQEWNATETGDRDLPPFIAMFERQVAERPEAPALSFEGRTVSYAELDAAARSIGRNLRKAGVGLGTGVAVYMNRSTNLVEVLLGIQKAGGYYVPLDPGFPIKRLQYMLEDSGAGALVTDAETTPRFNAPAGIAVLDAARLKAANENVDIDSFLPCVGRSDFAYVIYTSGSTGQPKGVVIEHGALSNFLVSMARRPGLSRDDVLLAVTTIAFDIAGLELYLPLSVGARIELAAKETAASAEALRQLISDSRATVLQATPATWRMLLDSGWEGSSSLRAFCGGEALSSDLANALVRRVSELWNLYGPTETTIWSTAARVEPGDADISIGAPIDNTRIYITDQTGELTPIGIPGEILIAGDGLARGYHARPGLTADRFVPDRFAGGDNRLYKTGDLGKWGSDGRLYHLGRIDTQVKIRGHRIETGEIETLLRKHPLVTQAVVIACPLTGGDVRLVAYVVSSDKGLIGSEFRNYLREDLPEYMVPSIIVTVDNIPLTPNGKIDRKALPDPFMREAEVTDEFEEPAEGLESTLAQIWRDLLKVPNISARDNFFELGGHSLLAVRLTRLLEKRTGKRLDPRRLYFQNLRQIAEDITRQ